MRIIEEGGVRFAEGQRGGPLMRSAEDAGLVVEACLSGGVDRALLYAQNLTAAFFDLSSGEAGAILQKLRSYGIRVAVVCPAGTVRFSSRFGEMAEEEARAGHFRMFESRRAACEWLRDGEAAPGALAYAVAAIAAIFGAGSLALFGLFLWTGAFGFVDMGFAPHAVFIWDAGLCLLFFLQHSGMVRRGFRARLERVMPAYCHGIVYTMASAVALLLLVAYWQPSSVNLYALEGVGRWLMRGVLLLSFAGFLWGVRSLGGFDAFCAQAFLSRGGRAPARLTIAGPYRFVRHPFYCFAIVALWAAPVLSLDRLLLNALFTAWIVFGAALEERDLLAEFGEDYRRYQRAVPMFVPARRVG